MASNIFQRLINEVWRSYDLGNVPTAKGIYAIGNKRGMVLYVGQSNNMQRRLREHKHGKQVIDQFVKEEFRQNNGVNLRIKWIEEGDHACLEGDYLKCLAEKLGYWPEYNMKGGNTC